MGEDKALKVGGEDDVARGLTDGDSLLQATSIDDDRADAVVAQVIGLSTDLRVLPSCVRLSQVASCGERADQLSLFVETVRVCSEAP